MAYQETAEVFNNGDGQKLRGYLHWPVSDVLPHGLVMCYPFAEERKSSARVMTWAARMFCLYGFHVLRFDYSGTGESDGDFENAAVRRWLLDMTQARRHLINRTGLADAGLFGIRFGATLAAMSEVTDGPYPSTILWAPVMSGRACLDECLRHLAATRLIADEEYSVELDGTFMGQEGGIDIGGYRLPPLLLNALEASELARDAIATARNVVVINFSSRASVPREYAELCEKLTCTTGTGKAINFPGRPFWVTASRYDPCALVEKTIQVMDEHRVVA